MSTEQAAYALVAYDRFINGKNTLYNMSDAVVPVSVVDENQNDNQNNNDNSNQNNDTNNNNNNSNSNSNTNTSNTGNINNNTNTGNTNTNSNTGKKNTNIDKDTSSTSTSKSIAKSTIRNSSSVSIVPSTLATGGIGGGILGGVSDEALVAEDNPVVDVPAVIDSVPTPQDSGADVGVAGGSDGGGFPIKMVIGIVAGLVALALISVLIIRGRKRFVRE
jgi:hypothetical protein